MMKENIVKIANSEEGDERDELIKDFIIDFWRVVFKGEDNFYWAMDDETKAKKRYGHHQVGWFNSKTEEYRTEHPDAQSILLKRIIWSSENFQKVSFDFKQARNNHQLLCVEMKLKQMYYSPKENFYLKIGMIPIWNEDYSEIVDYYDKPVVDFHD